MQTGPVKTDEHLREIIDYKDASFPLDIWKDVYGSFMDRTLNCHWHNAFEFGILTEGNLDFYTGETCLKLTKGDCIFVNSNVLHMAKQTSLRENAVMIGVGFPATLFPGGNAFHKYFQSVIRMPIEGFRIETANSYYPKISQTIRDICGLQERDYGFELRCFSLVSQLWLYTLDYISEETHSFVIKAAAHHHSNTVKKMIAYIQEHFSENITIRDLTNYTHVSRSECFRSFHRYTGKKPMEYINEYRLIQAANLLKETNLSISEIGNSCGFCSSSYFGKLFKEKYGVTPLGYRKGDVLFPDTPQ